MASPVVWLGAPTAGPVAQSRPGPFPDPRRTLAGPPPGAASRRPRRRRYQPFLRTLQQLCNQTVTIDPQPSYRDAYRGALTLMGAAHPAQAFSTTISVLPSRSRSQKKAGVSPPPISSASTSTPLFVSRACSARASAVASAMPVWLPAG
jgi:hypothetical protein